MAIEYKDINQLTQKSSVAGTEKIEVSDTEYITPSQIAGLVSVSGKADKVSSATNGDFAGLDSNGNLTDSGKKWSDFILRADINGEDAAKCAAFYDGPNDNSFALPGSDAAPDCDYIIEVANNKVSSWSSTTNNDHYPSEKLVKDSLDAKQATLVSGTNIKTINNESILGSGNITAGGGGDTSSCVHKTGDETIGGDKTFTDNIGVVDADHIVYSGGGGGGFTKGVATFGTKSGQTITFTGLSGEPKAFVLSAITDSIGGNNYTNGVVSVVMDSTGCKAIYNTGTQHNYSSAFSTSYSNGTLVVTAPSGVTWPSGIDFGLVYYYGDGTLTFKTSQIQPGSGVTAVTFTGTGLTEVPAMYACFLESAVNSESYRRVALYTNSALDEGDTQVSLGITFYSQLMANTTSSFSVSYNNGLYINSGGTNAGGYFHNPGTYTLYYLMASDVAGGGGGGFQSLGDELDDIRDTIGDIATILASI